MEKTIFQVEGMSCAHCEQAVQGAVGKLSGVKTVHADRLKKTAEVEYDPGLTPAAAIKAAIEDQGFDVTAY